MIDQVAIIGGTGPEGRGLAMRWARAGLKVIIGSRDQNRARTIAQEVIDQLGGKVQISGAENAAAVAQCDTIVLAVPFEGHHEALEGGLPFELGADYGDGSIGEQCRRSWKPSHRRVAGVGCGAGGGACARRRASGGGVPERFGGALNARRADRVRRDRVLGP
jgi:hypothetical protein